MTNEDLKRFYQDNPTFLEPFDFVRLDSNGKIPAGTLPSTVDLYQHNISFRHTTDDGPLYSFAFISNDGTEIDDLEGLLAVLFDLYGTSSFVGAVDQSGEGDYANPLGYFKASCGSTGDNLHVYTPCFVTSTFTIDETDYSLDKIVINHIADVELDSISDTVVKLN